MEKKDQDLFARSLLKVRNTEESSKFLEDLLTSAELKALTTRFKIARMLFAGDSYSDIERKTGASSATIAKVSEAIKYGNDGLRQVLERMKRAKVNL